MAINSEKKRFIASAYGVGVLVQILWCYFVDKNGCIGYLCDFSVIISGFYCGLGFQWGGDVDVVVSSVLGGFVINFVILLVYSLVFGWPRFAAHDLSTLLIMLARSLFYIAFVFLVIGVFGSNYSWGASDKYVAFVAIGGFLIGGIIYVIDDAISAVYVVTKGGVR